MKNNKIKIFVIYYFIYLTTIITISVYLAFNIKTDLFNIKPPEPGNDLFYEVISHNTKNFLMYIIAFPISPILQIFDVGGSFFMIALSCRIEGPYLTFRRLFPHSLIEFPNIILYQGVSQYLFYTLITEKSLRKIFILFKKLIPIYFISLIMLIVAALLEGYC